MSGVSFGPSDYSRKYAEWFPEGEAIEAYFRPIEVDLVSPRNTSPETALFWDSLQNDSSPSSNPFSGVAQKERSDGTGSRPDSTDEELAKLSSSYTFRPIDPSQTLLSESTRPSSSTSGYLISSPTEDSSMPVEQPLISPSSSASGSLISKAEGSSNLTLPVIAKSSDGTEIPGDELILIDANRAKSLEQMLNQGIIKCQSLCLDNLLKQSEGDEPSQVARRECIEKVGRIATQEEVHGMYPPKFTVVDGYQIKRKQPSNPRSAKCAKNRIVAELEKEVAKLGLLPNQGHYLPLEISSKILVLAKAINTLADWFMIPGRDYFKPEKISQSKLERFADQAPQLMPIVINTYVKNPLHLSELNDSTILVKSGRTKVPKRPVKQIENEGSSAVEPAAKRARKK